MNTVDTMNTYLGWKMAGRYFKKGEKAIKYEKGVALFSKSQTGPDYEEPVKGSDWNPSPTKYSFGYKKCF